MRGLTADTYPETWIDDLATDYDADMSEAVSAATADSVALADGATAKLQEGEARIAELEQLNTQLKAANYDLLTAVGTPTEPQNADDDPAPSDSDDEDPTAGFFDDDDDE